MSSESTGGIAMEKADLGCAPRNRLPRGLGSSSGAVGPRAVARARVDVEESAVSEGGRRRWAGVGPHRGGSVLL